MRKRVWASVVMVSILSAMFLTTSCAKKKVTQAEAVYQPEPEVQKVAPDTSKEDTEQAVRLPEEKPLQQEAAAPAVTEKKFDSENIYFAFDSSVLTDQARLILSNNADYLRKHSILSVTVEGHCDERGAETYNSALGKRRAESVKKFLVDQGISADRLATVSHGENKPIALGHDEASWAKNRRAEIVHNLNLVSADHKSMKY